MTLINRVPEVNSFRGSPKGLINADLAKECEKFKMPLAKNIVPTKLPILAALYTV